MIHLNAKQHWRYLGNSCNNSQPAIIKLLSTVDRQIICEQRLGIMNRLSFTHKDLSSWFFPELSTIAQHFTVTVNKNKTNEEEDRD